MATAKTTFALPDLRGRIPIGTGQGPGTQNYLLAESGGTETIIPTLAQLGAHTHAIDTSTFTAAASCKNGPGNERTPVGNVHASEAAGVTMPYSSAAPDGAMNVNPLAVSGHHRRTRRRNRRARQHAAVPDDELLHLALRRLPKRKPDGLSRDPMHQSRAGSKPVGRLRQLAWLALVFLFVQAASIPSAFAIDYTVTKTDDTNDGTCDSDCSLREAIVAANTNPGADRVVLGSSQTYTLSLGPFDPAGTLGPGHGDLDVTGRAHHRRKRIDRGRRRNRSRLRHTDDYEPGIRVTINTLTIRGGVARGFLSLGGGVRIQASIFRTMTRRACRSR